VHTSTRANPTRAITVTPPLAPYRSLRVEFDVQINGFSKPTKGSHGLLYLVRNNNKDMYGSLFLRGESRNVVTMRHGFNQTAGQKAKIERGFKPVNGQTYHVDYLYDPARNLIEMTVSRNGAVLVRITDKPNVNRVHIEQGDKVVIGLSHPHIDPHHEPASFGWVWSNVRATFVR
jgi:hypothetical protein